MLLKREHLNIITKERRNMSTETIISKFLDIVDRDGKNGKDLTLEYVVEVLREILNNQKEGI